MTNEQLIEKTQQLIAIPSTAANPVALRQAVEAIADLLKNCQNLTIERFEQNGKPSFLAYRGFVRPTKFDILLNAHVDVVPAEPSAFEPYIKDGKLYGRGALDMKGTAVVLANVFNEMVNVVPYALGLQIVSDEEVGGYDGVSYQIDQGVRSKFVVMGEYANERNTIYNAARGLCWAEIVFRGKAAHGGHLWNGINAVVKASNFAGAILKRYPTPENETWTSTASIANLTTPNETYNKVPDMAVLKIDFRFTQEDPVFKSRESVEAFIASIDPEAELVNLAVFEPAVNVEELNPYVQGLSTALHSVTGAQPRFLGRPGGSDGRHFALVKNDIIEFGLYGHNPHSSAECVELDSFAEYQAILKKFLASPITDTAQIKHQQAEPLHLSLLRQLVAMPTESGNTAANHKAINFIEHFLQTRSMHVERFERDGFSSLLATTKRGNRKPNVLLLAHTDVIPASPDQFELTSDGDLLLGRGVIDMKFAIANYLSLVDILKDDLQSYDFGIAITSDEEIGGRNGASILVNEMGVRPKVVIVPDGGENWQIETFAKSVQWLKLEAEGTSAHASKPWEGRSAIGALLAALHDIKELVPQTHSREDTTLTIGTIEGGEAGNKVPVYASALLDIRCGSLADFTRLPADIHRICQKYDVKNTFLVNDPPCITNLHDPLIASFRSIVKRIVGTEPAASYSYGTTDGRYFSAVGIPTIIIAPEGGGRHTEKEWLSKESFATFNTVLEHYVRAIGGQKIEAVKYAATAKEPAGQFSS